MNIMKRTRVKMCGTTRSEDIRNAVAFGVDALGFIFVKKSPRFVTSDQAYELIREVPSFITRVGVFVDSSLEEVKKTVAECGLTQVQLHGKETTQFCHDLRKWSKSLSICKAFRIDSDCPDVDISCYETSVDSILLDTFTKGAAGGTGIVFNWDIIDSLRIQKPLILAGGLGPENIKDALERVAPFAVDINSGVECSPGIKDRCKLQAVMQVIRESDGSTDF